MTLAYWAIILGSLSMITSIFGMILFFTNVPNLRWRMNRWEQRGDLSSLKIRKYTLPAFGDPIQACYRTSDYEEPLRCAGNACGNRLLTDGETFYQIPLPNQGDGAILPICLPCGSQEIARDN